MRCDETSLFFLNVTLPAPSPPAGIERGGLHLLTGPPAQAGGEGWQGAEGPGVGRLTDADARGPGGRTPGRAGSRRRGARAGLWWRGRRTPGPQRPQPRRSSPAVPGRRAGQAGSSGPGGAGASGGSAPGRARASGRGARPGGRARRPGAGCRWVSPHPGGGGMGSGPCHVSVPSAWFLLLHRPVRCPFPCRHRPSRANLISCSEKRLAFETSPRQSRGCCEAGTASGGPCTQKPSCISAHAECLLDSPVKQKYKIWKLQSLV